MAQFPEYHDESFETPNRFELHAVKGQTDVYDFERKPGHGTVGTPLNAKFIQNLQRWVEQTIDEKVSMGITIGTHQAPTHGEPGSIYIQLL